MVLNAALLSSAGFDPQPVERQRIATKAAIGASVKRHTIDGRVVIRGLDRLGASDLSHHSSMTELHEGWLSPTPSLHFASRSDLSRPSYCHSRLPLLPFCREVAKNGFNRLQRGVAIVTANVLPPPSRQVSSRQHLPSFLFIPSQIISGAHFASPHMLFLLPGMTIGGCTTGAPPMGLPDFPVIFR